MTTILLTSDKLKTGCDTLIIVETDPVGIIRRVFEVRRITDGNNIETIAEPYLCEGEWFIEPANYDLSFSELKEIMAALEPLTAKTTKGGAK